MRKILTAILASLLCLGAVGCGAYTNYQSSIADSETEAPTKPINSENRQKIYQLAVKDGRLTG